MCLHRAQKSHSVASRIALFEGGDSISAIRGRTVAFVHEFSGYSTAGGTDKIEHSPSTLQEAVSGFLFAPSYVFGLTSTACPSSTDYFPALERAFCAEGAYCSVVSRGACCRSGWAEDHA